MFSVKICSKGSFPEKLTCFRLKCAPNFPIGVYLNQEMTVVCKLTCFRSKGAWNGCFDAVLTCLFQIHVKFTSVWAWRCVVKRKRRPLGLLVIVASPKNNHKRCLEVLDLVHFGSACETLSHFGYKRSYSHYQKFRREQVFNRIQHLPDQINIDTSVAFAVKFDRAVPKMGQNEPFGLQLDHELAKTRPSCVSIRE